MTAAINLPLEMFPMNERDLDAVAALEQSVQAFPWSRGNFADSLKAGHSVWVSRIGGELVGFAIVSVVFEVADLLNIAVCKRFQGQGHGARLLRHAMEQARLHGADKMLLDVRPSNTKAVKLYQHFGFHQIDVRRGYYPAANGREDGLVFERELA